MYVVAHSLGNFIVVSALERAAIEKAPLTFSELVMAAPDVDRDYFFDKAAIFRSVTKNMTLYASSADKALLASEKKAWDKKMGYIGPTGPNLYKGVETIDVTAVGDDMFALNHGTATQNRSVLDDLGRIIVEAEHQSPIKRTPTLREMPDSLTVKYWAYPN